MDFIFKIAYDVISFFLYFFSSFCCYRLNFFPLPTGKLRYANNSNYKNDVMIRKEVSPFGMSDFLQFSFFLTSVLNLQKYT